MLDWLVEVRNPSRVRVGQFVDSDLSDFTCIPRANDVGSWEIKLPNSVIDERGIRVPHPLCAALRQENAGIIVTAPNGVVLSGPMIYAVSEQTAENPDGMWTITGVSDTIELAVKLAYPDPSNSNVATQAVANDVRTDDVEGLLRAFVSANIGPTATAARKVAGLTLTPDLNRGPVRTKSPRFTNLLELLQDTATGTAVLFDVVQQGTDLQFRVLSQLDASAAVRWDIDNRQLDSAKYGYGAPDLTRAIVAGQGEGTARTLVEVTTPASLAAEAIWGRRERFVDQRQTDDTSELTQKGQAELADGAVVRSLDVVPSSDMAAGFMSKWSLGALVTVTVGGQDVVVPVSEVPVKVTAAGLFVGAIVGDYVGFDWQSVLSKGQRSIESRVDALERNGEVPDVQAMLAALAPVGEYVAFAGRTIPASARCLPADGSAAGNRVTHANLFNYLVPVVGTVTVTIASPAVFTLNGHGLVAGDPVYLTTTGALPTGLTANTIYYVSATGLTANTFRLSATNGGAAVNTSGAQSGAHSLRFCPYGLGDGATTFNTPDVGDMTLVGMKAASAEFPSVGRSFGEKKHANTADENGPHAHSTNASFGVIVPQGSYYGVASNNNSGATGSSGLGTPHNNIQPSRSVLYGIRY